ncbi:carbohydrate sulfotransferase 8 isoform X2 [Denticeps clupeoides]|uniref:Carbohydrate sulfotransferase n=2 Tax=Denticeps clupeoides TaxID=299321 RepID=A0A8C4G8I6_9TELE|nr:carbohydrate sulfotransferase 8-like isoform X2 [Denticeps clupeoides]
MVLNRDAPSPSTQVTLPGRPSMPWVECRVMDVLRRRRRLRANLPCSFWFLLLFAAGGLVLFVHLQDLSEMVQQQVPGVKFSGATKQTSEELCAQFSEAQRARQDQRSLEETLTSPIPPMQFPAFAATPGSREQEPSSPRLTQRHRKLLKTSPVVRSPNMSTPVSSSSTSRTSHRTWARLSHVQEARQRLMKEVCAKYKSNISRTITPHHVSRIYVEDKYKLLYCEVPKAGCSNWKRVLMVLAGLASSASEINHDAVHYGNHIKRLDSFDRQGITQRLETYTKVLFVREPLERLVSAFRDKFESPNSYYHPVFGKAIISKYRANASRAALRTGSGVTFQEFMQYLLDVHRPVGMDIHWEPVHQLCSPCLLSYDFIGKFETMEQEANVLLERTGAPRNLTFPRFKDRNPGAERTSTGLMQRYVAQLSAAERQRAYDFYYMDYLMFNYSKPFQDLY